MAEEIHPLRHVGLSLKDSGLSLSVHSAVSMIATGVHSLQMLQIENPQLAVLLGEYEEKIRQLKQVAVSGPDPLRPILFYEDGMPN